MVEAAARLEELRIRCPFSPARLPGWIAAPSAILRTLGLHLGPSNLRSNSDTRGDDRWSLTRGRLRPLGAAVLGPAGAALRAVDRRRVSGRPRRRRVPGLTGLAQLRRECSGSVSFASPRYNAAALTSSRRLRSPRPVSSPLSELQGFSWMSLEHDNGTGDRPPEAPHNCQRQRVYTVRISRLPVPEQLSLRGVQWGWGAVSRVLRRAAEYEHFCISAEQKLITLESESLLS
ncbi:hypothetical protein ZWY2020_030025 [Hordeum vulgare]|nr:hypothetical protein ZWY2020_030025 [Hordeum vulgare]